MLFTAILGPLLTGFFAPRLIAEDAAGGDPGNPAPADVALSRSQRTTP